MHSVWIHGSFSSARFWCGWKAHIGAAIDLPGAMGQPPVTRDSGWSFEEDLAAVRSVWKGGTLVGHSYGGLVALRAGMVLPNVSCVVVHEPVCWPVLFARGTPEDLAMLDEGMQAFILDEELGGTVPWLRAFVDYWMGEGAFDGLPEPVRAAVIAGGWKSFLEVACAFRDPTPMEIWAAYPAPVRITVGETAQPAQRRVVELMSDLLPDVELVTVPGGHAAPRTHADAVASVWEPWLRVLQGRVHR